MMGRDEPDIEMTAASDGLLMGDATHVGDKTLPQVNGDDGMDACLVEIATRVNLIGMDMRKTKFPEESMEDHYENPRDLPAFWGTAPEDFGPHLLVEVHQRYKRAMLILHPDRHPSFNLQF